MAAFTRSVVMIAAALAVSATARGAVDSRTGQGAGPAQTVVFVCEHGAVKSVVAAALFNEIAAARGLAVRAIARGTDPDAEVPAPVRAGLASEKLGVDPLFTPTRVASADVTMAARVVVFDVPAPAGAEDRTIRWDKLPAFSDGYGPASAAMRARVEQLVRDLAERR